MFLLYAISLTTTCICLNKFSKMGKTVLVGVLALCNQYSAGSEVLHCTHTQSDLFYQTIFVLKFKLFFKSNNICSMLLASIILEFFFFRHLFFTVEKIALFL